MLRYKNKNKKTNDFFSFLFLLQIKESSTTLGTSKYNNNSNNTDNNNNGTVAKV